MIEFNFKKINKFRNLKVRDQLNPAFGTEESTLTLPVNFTSEKADKSSQNHKSTQTKIDFLVVAGEQSTANKDDNNNNDKKSGVRRRFSLFLKKSSQSNLEDDSNDSNRIRSNSLKLPDSPGFTNIVLNANNEPDFDVINFENTKLSLNDENLT